MQVRKTLLTLLSDRGFEVADSDKDATIAQFKTKCTHGGYINDPLLLTMRAHRVRSDCFFDFALLLLDAIHQKADPKPEELILPRSSAAQARTQKGRRAILGTQGQVRHG
jgi:hypothetical protein